MKTVYHSILALIGIGFALFFFITMGPIFWDNPDLIGAIKAGFVNPYASGFSTDTIVCWLVLATWVLYEKIEKGVSYGWVCLILGLVPGVATGFALYLILRNNQLRVETEDI